jgi:pyrroline-5-carboxylate reductase
MVNLDIHIVGIGNLGSSLATGLNNIKDELSIYLYDQNPQVSPMKNYQIKSEIDSISEGVLILCIKPKDIKNFISSNSHKISDNVLICTVLAGVEIGYLQKHFNNKIIRLMPNLSIKENIGFIPYTKNYEDDYLLFLKVLNGLGTISEYDEKLFHIITSIYGSGPAWYLELSSKIVEAAEKSGLEKTEANKIVKELVKSLPSFLSENEFSSTIDKIKSPNGTTEAGLNSLVDDSFDKIILNAIIAATNRSQEISQEISND